jgi:putative membrane protein
VSTGYLWVKTLHLMFLISWFAGLFYLPRLYVNLAMVPEGSVAERERLLVMSRKLHRFMGPLMVLALVFGVWLWLGYGVGAGTGWMHAKLALVAVLVAFHLACGRVLRQFSEGRNPHTHVWYRWFNEVPTIVLLLVLILVVLKPF